MVYCPKGQFFMHKSFNYSILTVCIIVLVLYMFQISPNSLLEFLSTPQLNTFITILAGFIAYVIYIKQKKDEKQAAANVIFLEIENAVRMLRKASESLKIGSDNLIHILPEKNYVMQTESWSKNSYMFVRDFTKEEWDGISDFYNKCKLFDQAVELNDSFFGKDLELARKNAHEALSNSLFLKIKEDLIDPKKDLTQQDDMDKLKKKLKGTKTIIEQIFLDPQHFVLYSPNKPMNDAIFYISNMNLSLLTSTAGEKLRKLAGLI